MFSKESKGKQVCDAITAGNADLALSIISDMKAQDLVYITQDQESLITLAAYNKMAAVALAVAAKMDTRAKHFLLNLPIHGSNLTAIQKAIRRSDDYAVRVLLALGADLKSIKWDDVIKTTTQIASIILDESPEIIKGLCSTQPYLIPMAFTCDNPQLGFFLMENIENPILFDIFGSSILHLAVYARDITSARKILGISPQFINKRTDFYEFTPLFSAVKNYCNAETDLERQEYIQIIELLLENGGDFTIASNGQFTVLHSAASDGAVALINMILNNAPQLLDLPCEDGFTPLFYATSYCHKEAAALLISRGANSAIIPSLLNTKDYRGMTPLLTAVRHGNIENTKYLIEAGADFLVVNTEGNNALHIAVTASSDLTPQYKLELIKLILEHSKELLFLRNNYGKTPVEVARGLDQDIVDLLVAEGADVFSDGPKYLIETPIPKAIIEGDIQTLMQEELQPFFSLQASLRFNTTTFAIQKNATLEVLEFLLSKLQDARKGALHIEHALYVAISCDRFDIVPLLMQHPFTSSRIMDWDKVTMLCLQEDRVARLDAVLSYYSSNAQTPALSDISQFQYSLIAESIKHNSIGCFNLLLSKIPDSKRTYYLEYSLLCAAEHNQINALKFILGLHEDVNLKNPRGFTPLHYAVQNSNFDMVQILLAHGAIIEADRSGTTPLHIAARIGNILMIQLLLENGADLHANDTVYGTPLHYAARSSQSVAVRFLLEKGSKVNSHSTRESDTPLHSVIESPIPIDQFTKAEFILTINALLEYGADLNAKNKSGFIPLHPASSMDIALLLMPSTQSFMEADETGYSILGLSLRTEVYYARNFILSVLIDAELSLGTPPETIVEHVKQQCQLNRYIDIDKATARRLLVALPQSKHKDFDLSIVKEQDRGIVRDYIASSKISKVEWPGAMDATVVLLSDGYLKLRERANENAARFFGTITQLPLIFQRQILNNVFYASYNFPADAVTQNLKQIIRLFELPNAFYRDV